MKLYRVLLASAFILGCAATAFAQEGEAKLVDEVIARVNAAMIMKSDYDRSQRDVLEELKQAGLKPEELEKKFGEAKASILDSLIDQQLLIQRAKDLSVDVEAQINQQLLRIMKENNLSSIEELEQKMREVGVDINEVRRNFRSKLLTDEVLRREVYGQIYRGLTEAEKREYYDKHAAVFTLPAEITLSRILIKLGKDPAQAQARASEVVAQARGGADFAALARRFSEEALGKEGGKMGPPVKIDLLVNEVRDVVGKAPTGTVTDPIKLPDGYVIFRIDDRKEAKTRGYEEEEVKQEVINRLIYERSQGEIESFLKRLRADAFIEIDPRYQLPGMKVQSASIKHVPFSEESEKERKKREKREKKEKEEQEKKKSADSAAAKVQP